MKRIIAIASAVSSLLYAGCCPEYKIDEQGRPVAVQKKVDKTCSAGEKNTYYFDFNHLPVVVKYVMIDGHEYVVARSDRGLGIAHSPRCKCRK